MAKKTDLDKALEALATVGTRRPYSARVEAVAPYGRIEAACNVATGEVITALGVELGSKSEAIRYLLARGAAALAADRA